MGDRLVGNLSEATRTNRVEERLRKSDHHAPTAGKGERYCSLPVADAPVPSLDPGTLAPAVPGSSRVSRRRAWRLADSLFQKCLLS